MTEEMKTCYLSGPMNGHEDYMERFSDAEKRMRDAGYAVLNPTRMWPEGLTYGQYLSLDFSVIDNCDVVAVLDGWIHSDGACAEVARARLLGKPVVHVDIPDVPMPDVFAETVE